LGAGAAAAWARGGAGPLGGLGQGEELGFACAMGRGKGGDGEQARQKGERMGRGCACRTRGGGWPKGKRKRVYYLWIKEFRIRFKGFLKRGLRGEFREESGKGPKELRRDSLRL